MKARRLKAPPKADMDINLTPMIDVVFNLIIFFMVITDLTQKDIEFLILPRAERAAPDESPDPERIIINIIDMSSGPNQKRVNNGELSLNKPPIMMNSRQIESLEQMRKDLRRRADPTRWPDKDKGQVAPGLYPSRKPALVRCDQGQIFGWVQAVMMYCTFVPGRAREAELAESPMIYKMEIAVAEPTK
jgi:biopolymer transport protein ExbD